MIHSYKGLLVISLLFIAFIPIGLAQGTTASITGRVADESDAVVPGVTITITNLDTGVSRTAISDDAGRYRTPELEVGSYEVKAELAGFQTSIRRGIQLTVGRSAVVDLTLKVGEVSEQVTVTGEVSLVETREATLAGVVTTQSIGDLPLNGRDFVQLTLLEAGVANAIKASTATISTIRGFGMNITVAGSRPTSNSFLLDGADINDHRNKMPGSISGVTLGVDSVREFKMLTTNFSAEYGRAGGGVITAITKSGTNEFHGSLFEFHRNDNLDARNFFAREKDPFVRNQFGGSIGGPIVKDQTFFFANYEGLRDRLGQTARINVPTAAARQGILPGLPPVQVAESVKPYLSLWPLPNGRDFGDGRGEYIYSFSEPTDENYVVGKVDHNFSQDHSFSVRYTFDNATALKDFNTRSWGKYFTRNQYATLEEKAIITPHLLNVARFSLVRSRQGDVNQVDLPTDPSLYFIPEAGEIGDLGVSGLGSVNPDDSRPREFVQNLFHFNDAITYDSGRHSWKMGTDIKRYQYNGLSVSRYGGRWSFDSLVDFLQANPRQIEAQLPTADSRRGLRNWVMAFYVQDDMQLRSNFALNLGLRYEFITVPNEVNNKISNLRFNSDRELSFGEPYFPNPSLRNFDPRIGFSWDPSGDGKTAIRSAFGVFHDQIAMVWFQQPAFRMLPAATVGVTRPSFPHPFGARLPQPGIDVPLQVFNFPWDGINNPYLMKWNLNIQREIVPGTVATIGYIGSRGVKLGRIDQYDIAQPEILPDGRRFFRQGTPTRNPAFEGIEVRTARANSFYHGMVLKVSRQFAEGFSLQGSYTLARSIDDISTVSNSTEFPGGTYQGTIDDPDSMRGLSEFDVRHSVVINGSWAIPGPAGDVWAVQLVKGWQLNGILSLSSGPPLTVALGSGWVFDAAQGQGQTYTPDLIPGGNNSPVLGGPDRYFDPTQFALPSRNFYGNVGRNTLIGPGRATLDFSLMKKTPFRLLGEKGEVEFRSEFFNIFNRPNFASPSLSVFDGRGRSQGAAGRITRTTTTERQIQFGLKITF
ncbi:MAG: TonB-dependent receptor [Acidobacteria bacterium]|nr:TonB-dependent receptor [Acidobacteriota bacterium]